MSIGNLFGTGGESNSLYGTSLASGGSIPPSSFIYFEWFIFKASTGQPATPTGGSWDFLTNTGVPPTGWSSTVNGVPANNLWFSVAFVDSRNPTNIVWSTTSLISAATSVYATAYADTFTGTGSTTSWTLSADPVTVNNLDVSINGVTQTPVTDYTIAGTLFTTTTAAPLGSIILVKYRQALPNSYYGSASNVQYTPAGTGAVATTVQTKLRQTVSVKDFGAVGDGVTNDASAIQLAFNTGSSIYFPQGTYYVGSTILTLPQNVVVYGDGASSIVLGNGANPVMVLTGTSGTHKSNLVLRDLTIKRTNGVYTSSRQLVEFTYADDCFIQNIIFDGDIATSAYPGSFIGYSVNRLTIDSCNFVNGASCQLTSYGVLSANPWSDECVIRNCYRAPAATQGFNFYYVKNLIVDGCTAAGSTSTYGCGFIIEYEALNITFTNCISFGHTRSGFYYEPSVAYGISNVSLSNCTAYSNGETGLYAQNIYRINVTGGAYHSTLSTFGGDYGGIAIHNGQDLAITGAQIFSNQGFGIFLDGGQSYSISGNFFNNNNGPAIKIGNSPATVGVQLVGNTFLSNISTVSGWVENSTGQWINGPWVSYTPTVYSNDGTTTVAITNSSIKYKLIGSVCHVEGYFEVTGSAANSTMYFTTPFTGDWIGGTTASALIMRGTAFGNSSGIKPIDGRYYNGRLSIVGMAVGDTQIKFTAAYDVAV